MNMTLISVGKLQMLWYIYSSGLSVEKDIAWLDAKERLVHLCTYAANELIASTKSDWYTTIGKQWSEQEKKFRGTYLLIQSKRETLMISGGFYFPEAASTTWNSIGYCAKAWVHWPCQKSEQGFHLTVVC